MTTLGFHYFPDDLHYRLADWQAWQPELQALGAKWLTLIGSLERAIPEAFIKSVQEAGLEPIIYIPCRPTRLIELGALEPLFTTYAKWGVRFVSVFSEPNTRAAWEAAEWGKSALVERFLDCALPVWQTQLDSGLAPVFPALKAGGDYWDMGFLETALTELNARQQTHLLKPMVFALNLWTLNRPLDWGAGGPQRWPQARPYLTPPGSHDQRGFHLYEWHSAIIEKQLGEKHPLICLAGGPRLGDHSDPNLPAVDEARHASCIRELQPQLGQLPEHLLNVNLWLLAATAHSPHAVEALYRADGSTLATIDVLKRAAITVRAATTARAATAKRPIAPLNANPQAKLFQHYVLLPTFEWGVSEWHWKAAFGLMKSHRPVCGFSPEEAQQAQAVTILGNEQGISPAIEQKLRDAGCVVKRVLVSS